MMLSRVCGKNYVMPYFSVDDFGTKFQVVSKQFEESDYELIVVPMETWWYLFDWEQEIRAEAS